MLGDTTAAVNSALQRARERLRREQAAGALARVHAPPEPSVEADLMRRFQEAWAAVDIEVPGRRRGRGNWLQPRVVHPRR